MASSTGDHCYRNNDSLASSNQANLMAKGDEGFSGMYATSVAFSRGGGESAKKNWVAELRAYAPTSTCVYDVLQDDNSTRRVKVTGAIQIWLFELDEHGNRTQHEVLLPTVTTSQITEIAYANTSDYTGTASFYYPNVGYNQEYDSYFEVEAADIDGDGIDEIFSYTGAYQDVDDVRYAIVDMFRFQLSKPGQTKYDVPLVHYISRIACGKSGNYLDSLSTYAKDKDDYAHWEVVKRSPVITLAAGDVDRDGKDELAVCASAPTGHAYAADVAHASVFKWDAASKNLVAYQGLENINLYEPDSNNDGIAEHSMVSANVAFGTFADTDANATTDAFIFAGYQTNDGDQTALRNEPLHKSGDRHPYSKFAYRMLFMDPDSGKWVITDYTAHDLGKDGRLITGSYHLEGRRYVPVFAPIALATANLSGVVPDPRGIMQTPLQNDEVLVAGDVYQANVTEPRSVLANDAFGSMSLSTHQVNHNQNNKNKEQVWIGDVVAGDLSNTQGDSTYGESFLGVVGVHRDEDLRKNDDYYWYDLSHFAYRRVENSKAGQPGQGKWTVDGTVVTSQEGVILEGNRRTENYNSWISLCLPNVDNDAIKMRYVEARHLYTEPTVLAVLQDAPYYGDLEEAEHYLVLGGTELGTSESSKTADGFSVSGELGGYMEGSVGFLAYADWELEVTAHLGYEHQWGEEVKYTTTYEAHAGEGNKVILYSIPVTYYYYQAYDPVANTWKDVILPQAGDPVHSILSAEKYDEAVRAIRDRWAKEHNDEKLQKMHYKLPLVSELLKNVSGKPETYTNENLGNDVATKAYLSKTKDSVNNSQGGTSNQEIELEKDTEGNFETGLGINGKLGWSAKAFGEEGGAGVVIGGEAGYTHFHSATVGTAFGGSVDNLPEDAEGYGFDWKLVSKIYLDKFAKDAPDESGKVRYVNDDGTPQGVWIVGFVVDNVKVPDIPMVQGFKVDALGDTWATLSWDKTLPNVDGLDVNDLHYVIHPVLADNTLGPGEKVAYGTTSYTLTGLSAGSTHTFVMKLEYQKSTDSKPTKESFQTPTLSFQTLKAGEKFSVTGITPNVQTVKIGEDGKAYSVADGKETPVEYVDFAVTAEYTAGTDVHKPQFRWQYHFVNRDADPSKGEQRSGWKDIGDSTDDNAYAIVIWPDQTLSGSGYDPAADKGKVTAILRVNAAKLDASMDGSWFRCRVFYDLDKYLYSQEAELRAQADDRPIDMARARFLNRRRTYVSMVGSLGASQVMNSFTYLGTQPGSAPVPIPAEPTPEPAEKPSQPTASTIPAEKPSQPTASATPAESTSTTVRVIPAAESAPAPNKTATYVARTAVPATGDRSHSGIAGLLAAVGALLAGIGLRVSSRARGRRSND